MSVQSKTAALILQNNCRFPSSSLSPIESHEQDTRAKSLKCFIDAFYLLAAWHESKLILQDAWLWMVLDWDDPLSGRLHKCLLLLRKKKQHLAIFCLGNGIFGDMAIDQDTWLLRINVLRDLNSCWLQVDWPQVANETTLNPVFYFLMLG